MTTTQSQHIIAKLTKDLKATLTGLQDEAVASELRKELHDDKKLPNKEITLAASEAIDLLGQIEQILEPSPLILADHFLGLLLTNRSFITPTD